MSTAIQRLSVESARQKFAESTQSVSGRVNVRLNLEFLHDVTHAKAKSVAANKEKTVRIRVDFISLAV
jgi:hypothetical protein